MHCNVTMSALIAQMSVNYAVSKAWPDHKYICTKMVWIIRLSRTANLAILATHTELFYKLNAPICIVYTL